MRRNYTDLLVLAVLFLMLVTMHCNGAIQSVISGNSCLVMTASYPQLDATTNNITISYWFRKSVTASGASGGGTFVSKEQSGLFHLQSFGVASWRIDFASTDWNTGFGSQLWRTDSGYNVTNVWDHHLWTFTYTDTNSMRFYINGVNRPGVWIQNPKALPGTNAPNLLGIQTQPSSGANPLHGKITEVAIWNKILNRQQIDMLRTSQVKGICKQIEPSLLRCYMPLDSAPWMIRAHNDDGGSGGKFNMFPERAVGLRIARQITPAAGGSCTGQGEPVHAYPPNE